MVVLLGVGLKRIAGSVLTAIPFALAAFFFFSAPARADFRVCNATQSLVGVSIGLRGSSGWITEGWWHIEPANCKTLLEGPLSSRFYYLYAEDAQRGGRWDGPINMCVADKEFKIVGINDCYARGYQRVGFQEHDTGEQINWMVQLTDEPQPGSDPASAVTPRPDQSASPEETPAAEPDSEGSQPNESGEEPSQSEQQESEDSTETSAPAEDSSAQ
ncbi:DUF1036 domain-containing protein [Notoacmeibacter ruber]|uniref:DUF1036 domain-containing protein n=1 Tax=Notoacmeibacter ruber TaxID=2670375 RepID=A0A3L7JFW9_9HYPH|nr:DUF1036 domain-containing protein [Notoacmeibacter ruber]